MNEIIHYVLTKCNANYYLVNVCLWPSSQRAYLSSWASMLTQLRG